MEPEQFRLINAIGDSLFKLGIGKLKTGQIPTTDQLIDQQLSLHDLVLLLGHPDEHIQIHSFKLLQGLDPNRFQERKPKNMLNLLTQEEKACYHQYIIHFLTSNIQSHYNYARQYILDNIEDFRNDLIHNLASNNDALVQNTCEILNEAIPVRFPTPNYYEIMRSLQMNEKEEILQLVKNKIHNSVDIPWNLRDGLIRILGALNYPPAAELLIQFTEDPDQNVRWTLAISLRNIHTPVSVKALYRLLLDQNEQIRQAAADSLGKIFPGLYQNKPPQEILYIIGKADPIELLKLMSPESFNQMVIRAWRRLEYDVSILQEGFDKQTKDLIDHLAKEKVQGVDFGAERTFFLLLSARMPESIDLLEMEINIETNEAKKAQLRRIRDQLQDLFKIRSKEDLYVLL